MRFVFIPILGISLWIAATATLDAQPEPVWQWSGKETGEGDFHGTSAVELPEVWEYYDPSGPFSIKVRLRPSGFSRLAGIVTDYAGSRSGGWYLSTGVSPPYSRPRVVVIDQTPYPGGYHAMDAGESLALNEWQTLVLISDGEEFTLVLDGEVLGVVALGETVLVPDQSRFRIGGRGSDFFQGEIDFVKLYDTALPLSDVVQARNFISNSSFEHGERLADALVWHRMTASPAAVVEMEEGWVVDDETAWHGERSLRGAAKQPLMLTEEVWAALPSEAPWVFSVYMKADRPGVRCELTVGLYWRLDEQTQSTTVELSTEWERYNLVIDEIPSTVRRGSRPKQGPVNFVITPLDEGTVWVDALQWELGTEPLSYQPQGPEAEWTDAPNLVFDSPTVQARDPEGESSWTGKIPLRVFREGEGDPGGMQPVSIGIPFDRGQWNGEGRVALQNATGDEIPVQTEVLTRWPGDDSVQMLGLFFADALEADWQEYDLILGHATEPESEDSDQSMAWEVRAPEVPGDLWAGISNAEDNQIVGPGSLRAVDFTGRIYESRLDQDAEWAWERRGPLHQTLRTTGRLMDDEGRALLAFTARVHWWRAVPGVKLEITAINSRDASSVRVRSIYWHAPGLDPVEIEVLDEERLKPVKAPLQVTNLYEPEEDRFFQHIDAGSDIRQIEGRHSLGFLANTEQGRFLLHKPEGWQRHPAAVGWADGEWRGYLWPGRPVRGLSFPRGLALTREFWLREVREGDGVNLAAWDSDPIGVAAPEWWATTDVILPFAASDPERFPLMEDRLGGMELLGRIGPESVERGRKYGSFDFGDNHGDGGWANLESFNDWSAFLSGLRGANEVALRTGLRGARHYRDIDMNQMSGLCYTHNLNHILGSTGLDHAWPEGVMVHYFLTGSKRSRELIVLHGESLLAMDLEDRSLVSGTRNLGRFLANLANVYQVTRDARLRERFFEQLEVSQQALAEDTTNPDRSIFSFVGNWESRRLVPYHAWYGIAAMQKMAGLTGDTELQELIDAEIEATLNPELYYLDLEELWPGVAPEEGMPIMIADFARHRGSYFYPVMIFHAQGSEDPAAARLALDALYAWAVEGRGTGQIQSIVASPPLNSVDPDTSEEELIERAADLMWRAAATGVLNSDFSKSADYWHHWRPFPGKSLAHHTNWQRRREDFASLDSAIAHTGERSLRLNLRPLRSQQRISVDTNRFQVSPGNHVVAGWIRWDQGALPPRIRLQVRDLKGGYEFVDVDLREEQPPRTSDTDALQVRSAEVAAPDAEGWRKVEIELHAPERLVASLFFTGTLKEAAQEGHVWIDGFEVGSD